MSATYPQSHRQDASPGCDPNLEAPSPREAPDTWLELHPDGSLTLFTGKVELGTGLATALARIVAEEVGVDPARVAVVMGDTARTPDQGTTAGSKSVQTAGPVLRQAAARLRRSLLAAASGPAPSVRDLDIRDGRVAPAGVTVDGMVNLGSPIGDLVTDLDADDDTDAPERDPASSRLVGSPRKDLLAKLTGGEAYVQDLRLPGMLHGRVVRPWVRTGDGIGTSTVAVDDRAVLAIPGVRVVRDGDFLGVVAEREHDAVRAAEALARGVTWGERAVLPTLAEYRARMPELVAETREVQAFGDVTAAMASAGRVLEATYHFPIQAHASLGPSCAVADVRPDGTTVYSHTQSVYGLRATLAPLLGMDEASIRVVYREGAGCYGHNGAEDAAADAALLSRSVGAPVRVQWGRQDEFAWEPKGPPMTVRLRGGIAPAGDVAAWKMDVWTPTHTQRPGGEPGHLLAGQQVDPPMPAPPLRFGGGDRNAATTYAFPATRVTAHWLAEAPLHPSALRSLGGLHNVTANELFLDELAAASGADPVEFRLRHEPDPRARAVIRAAAERAGWGKPLDWPNDGWRRGRGIACCRYEGRWTYVAMVAEVAVRPETGEVRVTQVLVAHDCGRVIDPDGVANQIEGNVVQGIGRALMEEVTWDAHEVTSLTWADYRIPTFPDIPAIEIVLLDRPDQPSWGAGEPAICPVTAAIGSAVFDAVGVRLREVPFTPDRVRDVLRGMSAVLDDEP